jgi:UDP-glucose 4-epimerase
MNILITGVAGLIGSRFARWVLQHRPGVTVIGVDDLSGGFLPNVPADVDFHRISLGQSHPGYLRMLFRKHCPAYVFHFAAFAAEGLSPFVRCHTVRNTWLATAELLSQCIEHEARRLVFTSSMAVYGAQHPPFAEHLCRHPIDPYGVGKAACERDIEIAGEQHGLSWSIIRPHNVYGDQQNIWGDYRNVLGIWMRQALQGEPLRVYGDGAQCRAFSYIDDCLPCFWIAATSAAADRQIINLGGTRPTSILDAARLVQQISGAEKIVHTEPRHEVQLAWSTWQRSVDVLGFADRTPLETGLRQMWTWAQDAWDRYPRRRDPAPLAYELERGLYSWWKP